MRTPIMQAFAWPEPARACGRRLDPLALPALHFEPPDLERFPALGLAFEVLSMGGTAGAIFNAANEEAVAAFLREDDGPAPMPFSRIHEVTAWTLANVGQSVRGGGGGDGGGGAQTLAHVFDADRAAREAARQRIAELAGVGVR
jgi:1-deoxy-D-xylulose-5-phosphate reductoisomerase